MSNTYGKVTLEWIRVFVAAGTLMGLTNTIATVPGFLGTSVVSALTADNVS